MQGAKTSKIILPRSRGVHLHKSASFKTIFETFLTHHKNDDEIDPKMIEIPLEHHQKHDAGKHRKILPHIRQFFRV